MRPKYEKLGQGATDYGSFGYFDYPGVPVHYSIHAAPSPGECIEVQMGIFVEAALIAAGMGDR